MPEVRSGASVSAPAGRCWSCERAPVQAGPAKEAPALAKTAFACFYDCLKVRRKSITAPTDLGSRRCCNGPCPIRTGSMFRLPCVIMPLNSLSDFVCTYAELSRGIATRRRGLSICGYTYHEDPHDAGGQATWAVACSRQTSYRASVSFHSSPAPGGVSSR
jgi:hypothetical protein